MQLNTLTLSSRLTFDRLQINFQLFDHKLTNIHREIFLFGKTITQFSTETSLLKLKLNPFEIQPLFHSHTPFFRQFEFFSFQGFLYFYGKTDQQDEKHSNHKLYKFDGCQFIQLNQNGQIPEFLTVYSSCIFNNNFLIIFGYIREKSFNSQWFILDLQKLIWRKIKCSHELPFCQRSELLWKNGRGYLFLQQTFSEKERSYEKNMLYEIKFKNFSNLNFQCEEIPLSREMKLQNNIFEHIFTFDDNTLLMISGEGLNESIKIQQISENVKKIYVLRLDTFSWEANPFLVKAKGFHGSMYYFQNHLIQIGGVYKNQILHEIQILHYNSELERFDKQNEVEPFKYEQSRCYNCEQAFTYQQKIIYEPRISTNYQSFSGKSKIERNFVKKISDQYSSEFQAIGALIDFMTYFKSQQISIKLCEQILPNRYSHLKSVVGAELTQILSFQGQSSSSTPRQLLSETFLNSRQSVDFSVEIMKLKMASLKIGTAFLFVTLTDENKIFIAYSSCSALQFPETHLKSFSTIYYFIDLENKNEKIEFSSKINRQTIYQNVKLHFGDHQAYEKIQSYKASIRYAKFFHRYLYILGVSNLENTLKSQKFSLKSYEDIRIQNQSPKNKFNSLQKYLRHFSPTNFTKFYLGTSLVTYKNVYEIYEIFQKSHSTKLISIKDDKPIKNQFEQTHFTTKQDDGIEKKIDLSDLGHQIAEKYVIYLIYENKKKKIDEYYQGFFIYSDKRLIKIISTRNKLCCGVIELSKNIQITLNFTNFTEKSQENKLLKWLQNIQKIHLNSNTSIPSSEF